MRSWALKQVFLESPHTDPQKVPLGFSGQISTQPEIFTAQVAPRSRGFHGPSGLQKGLKFRKTVPRGRFCGSWGLNQLRMVKNEGLGQNSTRKLQKSMFLWHFYGFETPFGHYHVEGAPCTSQRLKTSGLNILVWVRNYQKIPETKNVRLD